MHRIVLLIPFFFIAMTTYSQTDEFIVTFKQNETWIELFEKSPLDKKVEMVKNRLINDTAVYYPGQSVPIGILQDKMIHIPQNYVANLSISDLANDTFQINGFRGDSRMTYLINFSKKGKAHESFLFMRDSQTKVDDVIYVANVLNTENVENIILINPAQDELTLYGNSGFGAIIIVLNDKKDFKEIYKLIGRETLFNNGP
ncbi:MAG: hypothetical protein U0T82_07860 [Bacteroidales bacterium]